MGGDKLKNLKHGAIQRDFLEFLREGLILRKSTSKTLSSLRYLNIIMTQNNVDHNSEYYYDLHCAPQYLPELQASRDQSRPTILWLHQPVHTVSVSALTRFGETSINFSQELS